MSTLMPLSPLFAVVLTGVIALVVDLFRRPGGRGAAHLAWLTAAGHGMAIWLTWRAWPGSNGAAGAGLWEGSLMVDAYTLFFWAALSLFALLAMLFMIAIQIAACSSTYSESFDPGS